ncbi:MAG: hypothetical protein ACRDBG_21085 [Waterburya sp.]
MNVLVIEHQRVTEIIDKLSLVKPDIAKDIALEFDLPKEKVESLVNELHRTMNYHLVKWAQDQGWQGRR